ncbi:MAG: four helix bundle protein [Candidatus Moranbacteria bacterium]|nr:four helix bundle protein [Candidatus Moranbacteria bacterium]
MGIIESVAAAAFLKGEEKIPYIRLAIRKSDVLKIFLNILWETKSLDDKKYILLSEKLNSIGKDLGGRYGSLVKKTSPNNKGEEK